MIAAISISLAANASFADAPQGGNPMPTEDNMVTAESCLSLLNYINLLGRTLKNSPEQAMVSTQQEAWDQLLENFHSDLTERLSYYDDNCLQIS